MSSPSKFAPPEIKFKKLNDLPAKPYSQAEINSAMHVLYRQVTAQSDAYGGKFSKLLPVGIAELNTSGAINIQEIPKYIGANKMISFKNYLKEVNTEARKPLVDMKESQDVRNPLPDISSILKDDGYYIDKHNGQNTLIIYESSALMDEKDGCVEIKFDEQMETLEMSTGAPGGTQLSDRKTFKPNFLKPTKEEGQFDVDAICGEIHRRFSRF